MSTMPTVTALALAALKNMALERALLPGGAMYAPESFGGRRRRSSKGKPYRRILRGFTGVRRGFEHLGRRRWEFHATKGWRHYHD